MKARSRGEIACCLLAGLTALLAAVNAAREFRTYAAWGLDDSGFRGLLWLLIAAGWGLNLGWTLWKWKKKDEE